MNAKQKYPSKRERRTHKRVFIKQKVRCQDLDSFKNFVVRNLSRGGMFLETEFPPPVGTSLKIGLELPESREELELAGEVVQVRPFGAGVQFFNLKKETLQKIDAFIQTNSTDEFEGEVTMAGHLVHVTKDQNIINQHVTDPDRMSLPSILWQIKERKASGILRITHNDDFRLIEFRFGQPIEVISSSFNENHCLGRVLKRAGSISNDELEASLKEMHLTGKRQGTILLEKGILPWDKIQKGLEWQLELKIYEIFEWPQGEFSFSEIPLERNEQSESWVEPDIDLQHLIFRGLYRALRRTKSMTEWVLCSYEHFDLVPNKRALRQSNNKRLFTSEREIHIWHHIVHLNPTLAELNANQTFYSVNPNAMVFGLIAAKLVSLQDSNEIVTDNEYGLLKQTLNSDNFFLRLSLPWTIADSESIEEAHRQARVRIENMNGNTTTNEKNLFKRKVEEAYQILKNEPQRRSYREQIIEQESIEAMAERLYKLGKRQLHAGNYKHALPLLRSAVDMQPEKSEFATWYQRAIAARGE